MEGCQLEGEDDKAMGIALNAIFGWENDLEAEEKGLEEEFITHMKMHKLQHNAQSMSPHKLRTSTFAESNTLKQGSTGVSTLDH